MTAVSIHVSGTVQGVFFRKTTKGTADKLGVRGWVRNEEDGSVRIHAEAEESVLTNFIDWCHQGSPEAKVKHVDVKKVEEEGFQSFDVQR